MVAIWFQETGSFHVWDKIVMVARFRVATATLKGQDALKSSEWHFSISYFVLSLVLSFAAGVIATFIWLLYDS